MSASEDFRPKIVRWGKRLGGENAKWGKFIQAQQWGSGKSNNHTPTRQGGKTYSNRKLWRRSKAGIPAATRKGQKSRMV